MSSDYQLEDTVFLPFTTRAFATGIPTVLAGTPAIDIYEDVTATPIITGETLNVSLNSVVGFNMITVTATAGTGFEAGKSYTAIIEQGTVGGVSVVGEVVAHFTLDMSAAAKDLANGTDGLGAIKADTAEIGAAGAGLTAIDLPNQTMDIVGDITGNLSGSVGSVTAINTTGGAIDNVTLVATTTTNSDMRGTDSALLAASINLTGGAVDTVTTLTNKTGFSLAATGLDAIVSTATGMVEIAKAIWDRILSGATHNIATSAGRRLRQLEASFVITAGTAQAGTANTITLAAGESVTDDIFQGDRVIIVAGTGIEEHGIITAYNGTTKVATMSQNWAITPDATSEYELSPADVDVETWQHVTVTNSSTTTLPEVDAKSISDATAAADAITEARLAELDVGNLPTDIAALNDISVADILTTAMTESYAANGIAPTLAQAQFAMHQMLMQFGIAGTSITVRKLDDSTTAFVVTLDDATNPTDAKRV